VFRETVLAIVRERYIDFGPTLTAEKLSELHGLDLGVETLRQWMIGAGIWVRRKDRLKRIHKPLDRTQHLFLQLPRPLAAHDEVIDTQKLAIPRILFHGPLVADDEPVAREIPEQTLRGAVLQSP
jgi:hypothetical protein